MLGLADWVLIEDFGVFGGTGTDPNSMLPLLLLLVARLPRPLSGRQQRSRYAVPGRRFPLTPGRATAWWELLDSGYAGRLAAAVGAIAVVLIGTAPMVAASVNSRTDTDLVEAINGAPQPTSSPAPDFHLVDQRGQPVIIGQSARVHGGHDLPRSRLHDGLPGDRPGVQGGQPRCLAPRRDKVRFVAIAANPQYHSVTAIDDFDREEGLASQSNWLYLTGSTSTLARF